MAMKATGWVFELALAGAAATIVAYLIFWPGVYLISRKLFNLPRKTAAVLSSAISICGVSAAVATGGAVQVLLNQGVLQRFMDPDHNLLPSAYTTIQVFLERSSR